MSEGGGWPVLLPLPTGHLHGAQRRSWVCFAEQQTRLPAEDGGRAEAGEVASVREQGHQVLLLLLQQEAAWVRACLCQGGWLYPCHMSHTHALSVPSPHHTHTCPACAHLTHTHTLSWRTLQVSPCPELEDVARHTPHEGLTRLTPFLLPKPKSSGR